MFENDKDVQANKLAKKHKKNSRNSQDRSVTHKSTSYDITSNVQTEFSILDIANLTPLELNNKIFTYDRRLINGDLSKINEVGNLELEKIVAGLKCMKGFEKEYIPKFAFF